MLAKIVKENRKLNLKELLVLFFNDVQGELKNATLTYDPNLSLEGKLRVLDSIINT